MHIEVKEMDMKTKLLKVASLLALVSVLVLTNCNGFGSPLDSQDLEKIDAQIRESITKTFPLPESVDVKTHIAEDLRFSTNLTINEIVMIYRDAYNQKGYAEDASSLVSSESASLNFKKFGEKDVRLDVTKSGTVSDVHIWRVSPSSH